MTLAGQRTQTLLSPRRTKAAIAAAAVAAATLTLAPSSAAASDPCAVPVTSVIACENSLPGAAASSWQVSGQGDATIQGFATAMSVNVGETESFKVSTPASAWHFDILRMGYYQGNGARLIASNLKPSAALPQSQPACKNDTAPTGLIDCGNWAVSASWTAPSTTVSGVYLAHLIRNDTGGSSLIPFVVRNDSSHSDVVVQTSDETWQAYNTYGGNSLYSCTVNCPPGNPIAYKGASKVSYNRPWHSPLDDGGRSWLMYAEYPMVRFLEQNGYDVNYTSGLDVATRGSLLTNHKLFLSSGHDEYWTGPQRANVEAARDAGVNLAFFSGNEVFWKTRLEPSIDGSATANRTLVCYKDTHYNAPQDPTAWTGTWEDPRFSPPADGGRPQNGLTGQLFSVNSGTTDIQVPASYGKYRLWRNTAAAALTSGQTLTLGSGLGTLGYEWDEDADNGSRPTGMVDLSSTTAALTDVFQDYGSTTGPATVTHHLTLYRANSGALVFGAGTVQWAWGLDGATTGKAIDKNMQQATVNLFADMAVQPATLMSGLTAASTSSDISPPTSTITSPAPSSSTTDGTKLTVTGTAVDSGGGLVAGVEVSVDGAKTWHPAAGTNSWSYSSVVHGSPTTSILSRATDDSGNVEVPSAGVTVNVTCPCSVLGTATVPASADSGDGNAIEVGMKFTTDTFGIVSGLRFYKASTNTGTHVGDLWSASGQLLARATFTGETASGWQSVSFSQPVPIQANTTYVIAYYAPVGHYAQTEGYFYPSPSPTANSSDSVDSPPLHALRSNGVTSNGVYTYGGTPAFPASTFNAENYWVDPVFSAAPAPGQASNVTASAGYASAGVTWTAPTSGGPVTSYTITPYVGGTPQLAPTTVVTGAPAPTTATVTGLTNGTTYTFTVTASNPNGDGPPSAASSPVTPTLSSSVAQNAGFESGLTFWSPGGVAPPTASTTRAHSGTGSAVLGTASGTEPLGDSTLTQTIGVPSAGTTTLSFWYWPTTTDGLCSGATCQYDWEEAQVRTPAGATLASIFKSNSNAQAWTQVTLDLTKYAAQNVVLWFNVHQDGAIPPDDTSMYLDDVSVTNSQPTPPGVPTSVSATAGNAQATVSWTAPSAGGSTITKYTVTPFIGSVAQTPTTVTGSPAPTTATVTGLTNGTTYTFTVTATNAIGNGSPSAASNAVTPSPPTAPAAPTNVTATAGNASAGVSWTAPPNGGSAITTYTITPYVGSTTQTPFTVAGSPPATNATVTGLVNGTAYTFTVTATNAVGTGLASAASNTVTPNLSVPPAFVQKASAHSPSGAQLGATMPAPSTSGNRIVVATGSWSSGGATVSSVTDSSANTYTKIKSFKAPDGTETALWTAPVGNTGDVQLTVTAHATATTDIGISIAEYSGLSTVNDATVVDQQASASGTTGAASTVSSGVTPATTAGNELAVGFYVDSGFGATLAGSPSFTTRSNMSPTSDMEMLIEDQLVGFGATPAATVGTGSSTTWAMATVVFKSGAPPPPTAPTAPTSVTASAGNALATVSWTAPSNGGSAITAYTVTPYIGSAPQTPLTITGSPPATTSTVTGLTNGTAYTFTVTATNAVGTGPASAPSNAVTPTTPPAPTVPAAPTGVTATAANAAATVTWTAPNNGGSPITRYTITPYVGTAAQPTTTVTGSPPVTNASVPGLTNGTTYTFKVFATNAIGAGLESAASNPVTPTASPPLAIDKTVFKDGRSSLVSPTLTTAASGELIVAFVAMDGPVGAGKQTATVSGGGLTWTMAKRTNSQSGDSEIWWARAAGVLSNVTITAAPLLANFDGSLTVVAFTGAGGIGGTASAAATTGGPDVAVAGVAAGSWVFAVGNDWDTATARTVPSGQTMVQQRVDTAAGDTFWAQSTTAPTPTGGTVHVNDSAPTGDQWNYAAVEVLKA